MPDYRQQALRAVCGIAVAMLFTAVSAGAGQAAPQASEAQIRELRATLDAVQAQLAETRRQADALQQKVDAMESQLTELRRAAPSAVPVVGDQDLLAAKVEDQEQTKVASGSKYRMRLSGFVLVNLFGTHGAVDSIDVPRVAVARGDTGAFGASVRQSSIGLEVFGASIGGARTSGELTLDFFGGFPVTPVGVTEPLVRLKTARVSFDWKTASLVAGQDTPFFSPRTPSSIAATAYPGLSSAGNIWVWTPQVRAERRIAIGDAAHLSLQGGILDPLTGELPEEYARAATAGERTGIPAEAVRVGLQRAFGSRTLDIGGGGYYSRQSWAGTGVDSWAATADWDVPLGAFLALSGELYHGNALAGLGGGASVPVIVVGTTPADVHAVRSSGGWLQLHAAATPRVSFNAAYGRDRSSVPFDVGTPPLVLVDPATVTTNANAFANTIIQARSNLLFSIEYRRLWTTGMDDVTHRAHHFSFTTGIGF